MTTKRFLLDLLESQEKYIRDAQRNERDKAVFDFRLWKLDFIQKARALVEKGPDEP